MTATASYVASGSVGALMPTTLEAVAAAEAAIALPMADLQAQATGAAEAQAHVTVEPPSLELAAALEAAAKVPGVKVGVSTMVALSAEIGIEIGALQAALDLVVALKVQLGAAGAGIALLRADGAVNEMAGALGGQLAGGIPGASPTDEGLAVMLVAGADPVAIAALKALFALA